jgi:hypothetical protein
LTVFSAFFNFLALPIPYVLLSVAAGFYAIYQAMYQRSISFHLSREKYVLRSTSHYGPYAG